MIREEFETKMAEIVSCVAIMSRPREMIEFNRAFNTADHTTKAILAEFDRLTARVAELEEQNGMMEKLVNFWAAAPFFYKSDEK